MPSASLIYNPQAGRFPPKKPVQRAARALAAEGWQVEVHATRSAAHVTELARQAAAAGLDALFMAGGDGSAGYAVRGLLGSPTALGILPAGTANVWAQELGLPPGLSFLHPNALAVSAKLLARGASRAVDVGLCNGTPFLLWAGVGLDGLVIERLETRRKRWHKHFATPLYALNILKTAAAWPGVELTLTANGETVRGRFLMGLASNIRGYAGGLMQVSPHACLDDGEIDLWLFEGHGVAQTLRHVWNTWARQHLTDPRAHCIPFSTARLTSLEPLPVQLDGDPHPPTCDLALEVLPRAVHVLIPATAPKTLLDP